MPRVIMIDSDERLGALQALPLVGWLIVAGVSILGSLGGLYLAARRNRQLREQLVDDHYEYLRVTLLLIDEITDYNDYLKTNYSDDYDKLVDEFDKIDTIAVKKSLGNWWYVNLGIQSGAFAHFDKTTTQVGKLLHAVLLYLPNDDPRKEEFVERAQKNSETYFKQYSWFDEINANVARKATRAVEIVVEGAGKKIEEIVKEGKNSIDSSVDSMWSSVFGSAQKYQTALIIGAGVVGGLAMLALTKKKR